MVSGNFPTSHQAIALAQRKPLRFQECKKGCSSGGLHGNKNIVRRYRRILFGIAACTGLLVSHGRWNAYSTNSVETLRQVQQLMQQGDLVRARNRLTQAVKEFPTEAGFHDLLGVIDAQEGNYREAETNFERAIRMDPRLIGAYLNLGHLYQANSGKDGEALKK